MAGYKLFANWRWRRRIIVAIAPLVAILLHQPGGFTWLPQPAHWGLSFRRAFTKGTFSMSSSTRKTHFRTIQSFATDYAPVTISQHVSERTGMHVVVVDQKGPKVQGYFVLATEIFDDSGSPHTLEHLVFMGSKNYQYKGLLDKLASRAYSNTNAWTATDHTAYTLDTAGWEGFAQILPVYLEHLILPTLTDEGCYTEVHHIDGEGNDAGVVYSEMQGVQNNADERMDLQARRLLYPDGIGFRYETGGLMENLRVLTADRIRAFHKEMYQPKNLCLVIVGESDHEQLFRILDEFETDILDDIPPPEAPFRRPFLESPQPPPIKESIIETVLFPDEDESTGEVAISMFGPNCNDPVAVSALNVLLLYLAGSSVSILENVIVEKEALASSIGYSWDSRPNSVIWLRPSGVATEKLAHVEKRLFELLKEVASNPLDMDYISDCVKRERRQEKYYAETSGEMLSNAIINDFVFGKRDGSNLRVLETLKEYDVLESWSDQEWRDFLKKWISDAPHISLFVTPSKALSDEIKSTEEARLAARREELGPEGLAKLAEKLKAASAKNDVEIPSSLLQKWPVPGVDSIHFIETITARSGLARKLGTSSNKVQKLIDSSNSDLPLFVQFQNVPSNFVLVTLLISTSQLTTELRPLLPLFQDNFFNTPIIKDGKKVDFEAVVTRLEQDTVSYTFAGAGYLEDPEGLAINFLVEPDKYATAIEWIRTMMFDSIFDETRLNAGLSKLLADLPETKRDGSNMMWAVNNMIHIDKESNYKARSPLVKGAYLKRLKKLLAKDSKAVISSLETMRKSLFRFENMRALVVANVEKLPNPTEAWKPLLAALDPTPELNPLVKLYNHLSPDGQNPGSYGVVVVPMPPIDSSFLVSTIRGPTSPLDPLIPALLVTISFLEAVEGPLWSAVRGKGLAYGARISRDMDCGFIQFSLYRAPDSYRAFVAAKEEIEKYVDGRNKFEVAALEGAVSGIVVKFAGEQATMADAGQFEFVNGVVRGVGEGYNEGLLKAVRGVGVEEIRGVMRDLLLKVFEPGSANVVVTAAPIMEEGLVKGFSELGFKTQVQPLSSFQESYGLEADGDEEQDEEDEDEDMEDGSEGSESEED